MPPGVSTNDIPGQESGDPIDTAEGQSLPERLRECADEVQSFPHPSHCDHLHIAHHLMNRAANEIENATAATAALRAELAQAQERCEFMLAATREAQAFASKYADEVMELRPQLAQARADAERPDCKAGEELAMMIRMLVSSLRRHWPHAPQSGDLPSRAVDLLRRHDLLGSPLRIDVDHESAPKAIDAAIRPTATPNPDPA
jgi:hypothetical protein